MDITWEEKELQLMKAACGSIRKIRSKVTGKMIELRDNNTVAIYDSDGLIIMEFPNLRKALRFNWKRFYDKGHA